VRFSGSWSVRLRGAGYHSNHVHPQGWISSAFYVALPNAGPQDGPDAGWLTLGEPHAQLKLDLPAFRRVAPRPGQLVLFPSWMWHGTVPFAEGERLTVAFDVAVPR
jgi:predicted 2-oxoglutarate/Fe(II)-dependent dioxygenase YbiX